MEINLFIKKVNGYLKTKSIYKNILDICLVNLSIRVLIKSTQIVCTTVLYILYPILFLI